MSSDSSRKQIFKEVFLFYNKLYVVCTYWYHLIEAILMSTLNIPFLSKRSKKCTKKLLFASWHGPMINSQWLEQPISRTNFHCHNEVRAIEVRLDTVDSRYLELQGTLWNTSRYPYFDISDLRNWGKQLIEQPLLTEWMCNLTPKLEIYWKYCGKEEKLLLRSNFSSFPQYFVACW